MISTLKGLVISDYLMRNGALRYSKLATQNDDTRLTDVAESTLSHIDRQRSNITESRPFLGELYRIPRRLQLSRNPP